MKNTLEKLAAWTHDGVFCSTDSTTEQQEFDAAVAAGFAEKINDGSGNEYRITASGIAALRL